MVLAIPLTQAAVGPFAAFHACVREMNFMVTQLTHDKATLSRRRWLAATAALVLGLATFSTAKAADDTIKVGVLHSLSGTMAISETTLKDTVLFLIDEQNKKGGLLGKKLEAVVVDPASNWPLFAEKARELITKDKVAVVFGCWTSVSRKSVLPVFKELNTSCSTRCSTRVRRARTMSSTPVPPRTSRRFRLSSI